MMEQKIDIDENKHTSALLERLSKMREEREHCDFTIKVGSVEIPVHRNILSAGSDYFNAMLSHDTKENHSGLVEMKEVDSMSVEKCIDFIYSGKISVLNEKVEDLLHIATMMQLEVLCDGIACFLEANLDPKSFLITKRLSNMYNIKHLEKKCDQFALENVEKISKLEDFGQLDKNYIIKMIKSDNLKVSEETKLVASLTWIKFDSESRGRFLDTFLKFVALPKLSLGYRRHLIEKEPLIYKNYELLRKFSVSVMDSMDLKPTGWKQIQNNDAIAIFDRNSGYLQCFNPKDNTLTQMQKMNRSMMMKHFTAVTLDNSIYVMLEQRAFYRLRYLNKDAHWEKMADMLKNHGASPPAVSLEGSIYVIGGHYDHATNAVEKFDSSINAWTKLPHQPRSSYGFKVTVFQGLIYCIGGMIGGDLYTNLVERFDQESQLWTVVTAMNKNRAYASATSLAGKLYVLGGDSPVCEKTVECFNPETNDWTTLKSMLKGRSWFQTFVIHGDLYAVGGYNSDSMEKFNIDQNKWKMVEIPDRKLLIHESVKMKLDI